MVPREEPLRVPFQPLRTHPSLPFPMLSASPRLASVPATYAFMPCPLYQITSSLLLLLLPSPPSAGCISLCCPPFIAVLPFLPLPLRPVVPAPLSPRRAGKLIRDRDADVGNEGAGSATDTETDRITDRSFFLPFLFFFLLLLLFFFELTLLAPRRPHICIVCSSSFDSCFGGACSSDSLTD